MPDSRPSWMTEVENDQLDPELAAEFDRVLSSRQPDLKFAPGMFDAGKSAGWRSEDTPVPAPVAAPIPQGQQPSNGSVVAPAPVNGQSGGAAPTTPPPATPEDAAGHEDKPLPPPAPGVAPVIPDAPSVITITTPSGDPVAITNDQANYLLQVHSWLQALPQEVREQWRQIEAGESVAVPKSDYDRWKAGNTAPSPTPQTPTQPAVQRPQGYDPSLVPGDVADYIAKLEATTTTPVSAPPSLPAPAATPGAPAPDPATFHAQVQREAARQSSLNEAIIAGRDAVAREYALTPEQVRYLETTLPGLNIIPSIAAKHRSLSPTGQVISENFQATFTEAFQTAMVMDPQLRSIRDTHLFNQQTAQQQETIKNVQGKKAAASTLATAPSAAVPSPTVDMSKLTPGQRQAFVRERMTEELAMAMSGQEIPN